MKYSQLIAWLLLAACGQEKGALSSLHDHSLPTPAQSSQAVLGKGYDTSEERFAGDCVTGTTQYVGASESSVQFDRSLSAKETADTLGFSMGGKARYGVVTASASAKFASEATGNDYSEATIYSAEYRFKNAKLAYTGLSDVGKAAKQGHGPYVWENWEKTCGHEYVEQIQLGARIMLSAKVEFSTKEDKKSFSAEFKIKGPAFSASGELAKASRTFGKSAAVSIRAYQVGGDVSRLSAIFGSGSGAKVDSEGRQVHALIVCSMDRIDACMKVLDGALSYATDTKDPDAFPNQIKPNYDPSRPDGPAELAYITKPWSDLALYPPPALVADIIKASRAELGFLFEDWLKKRNRITALISGPFRLSQRQSESVEAAEAVVSSNIGAIYQVALGCYTQIETCVPRVAGLKSELKALDEDALEITPESFSQWCDAFESGLAGKSVRGAIAGLMALASQEVDLSKFSDKCAAAQANLMERRELKLSDQGIESLRPLVSFKKNLVKLNLSRNAIEDVDLLADFTSLRELNLNSNRLENLNGVSGLSSLQSLKAAGNRLVDASSLKSLTNLETLYLADNELTSLSGLEGLTQLKTLQLNNNKLEDLGPIVQLIRLEQLDLSRNRIKDSTPLLGLPRLRSLDVSENPMGCPSVLSAICVLSM